MALYSWQNIQRRLPTDRIIHGTEIGVHQGVLSNALLHNIKNLNLVMIDIWSPDSYRHKGEDAASKKAQSIYQNNWFDNYKMAFNVAMTYPKRTLILREDSYNASQLFDNEYFDFVFIDASHSYFDVLSDINAWMRTIKKGGWISGHDYGGQYEGVKQAVDELFPDAEKDSDFTWFYKIK